MPASLRRETGQNTEDRKLQQRSPRILQLSSTIGRVIAQADIRRLPMAAARVRAQVSSCEICGWQSGTGAGFLRVLRFPLPILIPPTAPHSSSIIRGWYNRPVSGRRTKWTQSHPTLRKLKKNIHDVEGILGNTTVWNRKMLRTYHRNTEGYK
jgi:hypothetical protein